MARFRTTVDSDRGKQVSRLGHSGQWATLDGDSFGVKIVASRLSHEETGPRGGQHVVDDGDEFEVWITGGRGFGEPTPDRLLLTLNKNGLDRLEVNSCPTLDTETRNFKGGIERTLSASRVGKQVTVRVNGWGLGIEATGIVDSKLVEGPHIRIETTSGSGYGPTTYPAVLTLSADGVRSLR